MFVAILGGRTNTIVIVHIITGLGDGGAEAVLYRLCTHDRANHHHVISLSGAGKYGPMLTSRGVSITTLNISAGLPSPMSFLRLLKLLRQEKPDIVQTWMYHGDLLGGLAARAAGIRALVWGIRHTTLEPGKSKKTTIWIVRLLAKLSWWLPSLIVVCAQEAMDVHEALSYDRQKMRFIPNGYDLDDFRPGLGPENELKDILVSDPSLALIGMVGRFNSQKDHTNLLDALIILHDSGLKFQCLLVGTGLDSSNEQLLEWIDKRGLTNNVQLIGQRSDIPNIMNALDLHVLSSAYGEAFPNVVAEAMACGTPCVVTDVGAAAYIVGDTGWVVPPRNADALAEAIESALFLISDVAERDKRASQARRRIEEHFSIARMVSSYHTVWNEAARRASS